MELYEENYCSGCGLCSELCPKNAIIVAKNSEGFLYPVIDRKKCVECELCKQICPFNHISSTKNTPLLSLAVKANNDDFRQKSSSGGVFPVLAEYEINDCSGVVFGAVYNTENHMKVEHIRIDNTSDINRLQGSKYVQSNICDIYELLGKDLKKGRNVLFCGTPCQVDACKTYLKNKSIDTKNFLTCDFICHGVPSPGLWEEYIKVLEKKSGEKVKGYDFRYKDENCLWGTVNVCVEYENHTEVNTPLAKAFINTYFNNVITRQSCANCPYTNIHRQSDITLADCWGIEKVLPDFADGLGVSLVLANTPKGFDAIEVMKKRIIAKPVNAEDLSQPHLHEPCRPSSERAKFWKIYYKSGLLKAMKKNTDLGLIKRMKRRLVKVMVKAYHIVKKLPMHRKVIEFVGENLKDQKSYT